ncbi:MAG: PulJ/GspJ family protein [Sporichthyaceae bacterium]
MKRRGSARDDTGAGLIEVLVGIVIFSVVMGLLATFTIDMLRKGSATSNRVTNVDQLRVAMDEISKGLRIAVRPEQLNAACTGTCDVTLYAPTATSVAFYANHGDAAGARLTSYSVEADPDRPGTGRLVATLKPAAAPVALAPSTCVTNCVSRTLVRGLVWPVPTAPFTYAGPTCSGFAAPPAPQPAAVSTSVACVAVDLRVAGARDNAGTSVTSTVFLPNSVIGR